MTDLTTDQNLRHSLQILVHANNCTTLQMKCQQTEYTCWVRVTDLNIRTYMIIHLFKSLDKSFYIIT